MVVKVINDVGKRIQQARVAAGLNQSELALQLNIKPQSVQNWERGKALPKTARIEYVAKVLRVTSAWLLHGETESSVPDDSFNQDEILLVRLYRRMDKTRQPVFIEIADALANKKDVA